MGYWVSFMQPLEAHPPTLPLPRPTTLPTCVAARRVVLGRRQVGVHDTAPLVPAGRLRQRDAHLFGRD